MIKNIKQVFFYVVAATFLASSFIFVTQQSYKKNSFNNTPPIYSSDSKYPTKNLSQMSESTSYPSSLKKNKNVSLFSSKQFASTPFSWINTLNTLLDTDPSFQTSNNPFSKATLFDLKKSIPATRKSDLFKKESEITDFKLKEKKERPIIGFSYCHPNSRGPDSLSQKLLNNQKNHEKENIFPFDPFNCGIIQTSFPLSF